MSARWSYLDEVIEDSFAGHVTVESVVSVHEVRSEMMQQRVQVQRVVAALLTAVDTLTALRHTHTSGSCDINGVFLLFF